MKTTIPVFTCGYCGNMNVKQGDETCSACNGRFDWDNSTVEDSPVSTEIKTMEIEQAKKRVRENVSPKQKVEDVKTETSFLNVPTWTSETVTEKPSKKCPCQETATPFSEQARMDNLKRQQERQKYAVAVRNMYKTARIVIIGVASPFDMMKVEKFRRDHPNTTSMFSSRIVWMFAEGKDQAPHVSWLWNKDRAEIEKYARLMYKVIVADVDEVTSSNGKAHYNVARHVMKPERSLSTVEVENAIDMLPSKFKVKSIDSIPEMETDPEFRKFCTVDGLVLWKRLFESGNILNILPESEGFDAKALRVMVPKMHDMNDISEGDIVIVTGDWYMNKKYDREKCRVVDTTEPAISAMGIVSINKVDKADAEYLAGFK